MHWGKDKYVNDLWEGQGYARRNQKWTEMYNTLMSQSLDPDAMLEAVINGTTIDVQDTLQNWLGALMD